MPAKRNARPLSGVRVLVGRARHQAGALSGELRKLGAQVLEIPFIEIHRPRSFKPLDSALKNLRDYDWLILTSVNGVEAMWKRIEKLGLPRLETAGQGQEREGQSFSRAVRTTRTSAALAAEGRRLRVAAIGPATKKAIEQRSLNVDVVPNEYVAESVVRSLRNKVKGKRVLLVRAKVARDVIPRELRNAGADVDVVEAYETVVPRMSRSQIRTAINNPGRRPHVVTFTSSSTVRNFVALLGGKAPSHNVPALSQRIQAHLDGIRFASIGPVTSSTLREFGLPVDIEARQFTIPGLVQAIVSAISRNPIAPGVRRSKLRF